MQLDPLIARDQRSEDFARFLHRDILAKAARSPEGEAEELELVGADPGALFEQLDAARAHLRVILARQQFEAVIERAHRAQHVVAQARTQEGGKVERSRCGHR